MIVEEDGGEVETGMAEDGGKEREEETTSIIMEKTKEEEEITVRNYYKIL